MTRIYTVVHIRQPPKLVFEFVTTPGHWPTCHPSSLRVSGATDHSLELGEQVTEEFRVAGRLDRATWMVRGRTAPSRWVIEGQGAAGGSAKIAHTMTPQAEGTRFERELVYEMPNLVLAALDWLVLRRRVERESSEALQRLKQVLEAD